MDDAIAAAGAGLQFHFNDHALFSHIIDVTIRITEGVDLLRLVAFSADTLFASRLLTVTVIAAWTCGFVRGFESAIKTRLHSPKPPMSN